MSNIPFTRAEAKELRNQFIRLVIERDELIGKLEAHREVLDELEDIRKFLTSDPTSFTATAATNGHITNGLVYVDAPRPPTDTHGDDPAAVVMAPNDPAPELYDRDPAQADDSQCDPPGAIRCTGGTPAADTAGIAVNGTSNGHVASTCAAAVTPPTDTHGELSDANGAGRTPAVTLAGEALPPSDNRHGERNADDTATAGIAALDPEQVTGEALPAVVKSCAGEQPADDAPFDRPPEGTLMLRILTAIEESDKPRRGWHIQKQLGLPRVPTQELSRLVRRGLLTRHGESIYGVAGRTYDQANT